MPADAVVEFMPARQFAVQEQPALSRTDTAIFYGTMCLLLFGPVAFGADEPWSRFIVEAGSAALLLVWLRQFIRRELRIEDNPLFPPLLAFAGLTVWQLLAGTAAYRSRTLSSALQYTAYGILCFLVVQCLRRTRQVKIAAATISTYGASIALFATLQSLTATDKLYWIWKPQFGGWIFGPYVNHNHYAGLMEMLVPVPLVFSLTNYARGASRKLATVSAALMACTIFLSGSRGGMAAFITEMMVLAILVARTRMRAKTTFAITAFLLLVVAFVAWLGASEVAQRISSIRSETQSELSRGTRLSIYRDSIKMFEQRPITGWGLGVFPEVYPRFRGFYSRFYVNRAHNDYLQLLTEMGLAGSCLMLWWIIQTYRWGVKKIGNWESDVNGAVALAALVACTGILVHSLVDSNLQVPANAALFYVMCMLAAMESRFTSSRQMYRTRYDRMNAVACD